MNKKKKSVKNRIFVSNTIMVLVTLLVFLLVNTSVFKVYEETYYSKKIQSSENKTSTSEVKKILEDITFSNNELSFNSIASELNDHDFQIVILNDSNVLYSSIDELGDNLSNYLMDYKPEDETVCVYFAMDMTVLSRKYINSDLEIYAISNDYESYIAGYTSYVVAFLINGLICIVGLIVISQIFTKRLTKHIIAPLELLSNGAKRVKDGNLNEAIHYSGDLEFEVVCKNFNDMQTSILEKEQQNTSYEKSRNDMITGISHDLRTPLTAIKGSIKGIQDGIASSPEMQSKFLETAYRRTLDMDKLLERLFFFSKLETGNMPIYMQQVNIAKFLKNYCNEEEYMQKNADIKFNFKTTSDNIDLDIDTDFFKRILDNLIENSIKYAQAEKLEININVVEYFDTVQISFFDNGVGISDDSLSHIFEEFYRGDKSRNLNSGNGLGLYITKSLIESMGGCITANGSPSLKIDIEFPKILKGLENE